MASFPGTELRAGKTPGRVTLAVQDVVYPLKVLWLVLFLASGNWSNKSPRRLFCLVAQGCLISWRRSFGGRNQRLVG